MTETIAIIRNPSAGQKKGPFVDAVIKALEEAGKTVWVIETQFAGHAINIARKLAEKGEVGAIVAAGGDGTIREVAEGVYGHNVPVGIIPAGTANVLARELGYMRRGAITVKQTVEALTSGEITSFYPFQVATSDGNHLGFCWLGAGFDAAVLERVNSKWKARVGRLAFVPATIRAMFAEPSTPSVPWQISSKKMEAQKGLCGWAVIANIGLYAGSFTLTKKTAAHEKGLVCLFMNKAGAWARMVNQSNLLFKGLDRTASTRPLKKKSLTLGDNKTALQLDGDYLGHGPAMVSLLETPVRFLRGKKKK